MEKIVCAIRGGDTSRRAQERAIQLGQERNGSVVFLHIIDIDLINQMDTSLTDAVQVEMEQIGRALLTIAVERAQAQGVKAEKVIRTGSVRQTLEVFLREVQASVLVLGAPDGGSKYNTFTRAQFDAFVEQMKATLGIDVEIVQ